MPLFLHRPESWAIDFEASRFIVTKSCGVEIDGNRKLEMGEEIPKGALEADVLRQIYERPLCLIDTLEFVLQEPELREACARSGASWQTPEESEGEEASFAPPSLEEMNAMTRTELLALAEKLGVEVSGGAKQIRQQIRHHTASQLA